MFLLNKFFIFSQTLVWIFCNSWFYVFNRFFLLCSLLYYRPNMCSIVLVALTSCFLTLGCVCSFHILLILELSFYLCLCLNLFDLSFCCNIVVVVIHRRPIMQYRSVNEQRNMLINVLTTMHYAN